VAAYALMAVKVDAQALVAEPLAATADVPDVKPLCDSGEDFSSQ
jgi:hypothetical protein